jgi:transposase
MTQTTNWIGVDVCQDWLDVHILATGEIVRQANTTAGIATLIQAWQSIADIQVVLESTGGLERPFVKALQTAAIAVSMVNPRAVRDFAKALGKVKTDAMDAAVLAQFGATVKPRTQAAVSVLAQNLADLVRRRQQLVTMKVAEKNRLSRAPVVLRADIKAHIKQLEERIEQLNQQIQTLAQQQRGGPRKQSILCSVKGIGAVTAALCLAELPELGQLSDKEIARLVGVAPLNQDSGQHRGKRMIQGGRTTVRCGLYMATLVATQHNPVIRAFYDRLLERGKPKMVALVACMRKLLVIINAMIRDDKLWEDPA